MKALKFVFQIDNYYVKGCRTVGVSSKVKLIEAIETTEAYILDVESWFYRFSIQIKCAHS